MDYQTPRQHLFETLGLNPKKTGKHRVGRGIVLWESLSPAALSYKANGGHRVRELTKQAAEAVNLRWTQSAALVLRRGPYLVASALDVLPPGESPVTLTGRFIDLFEPELPVISSLKLAAGTRKLLLDLDRVKGPEPRVIAAACRIYDEKAEGNTLRFRTEGIADTKGVIRILDPESPSVILVNGEPLAKDAYEMTEGTLCLWFPNSAKGVEIEIRF